MTTTTTVCVFCTTVSLLQSTGNSPLNEKNILLPFFFSCFFFSAEKKKVGYSQNESEQGARWATIVYLLSLSPLPLDAKIKKRERLKYISFKWRTSRYEWTGIALRRVDDWHHLMSIEIDGWRRKRETQRKTHYRFNHRTEMSDSVQMKREKTPWHKCAGVTKEKEFIDRKLCEERATGAFVPVND